MYAGTSAQLVHAVQPVADIVADLVRDATAAAARANALMQQLANGETIQ